jgi:membrane protease YdiL (CAAX protease family)
MAGRFVPTYAVALAFAGGCSIAFQRNPFVTESALGAEGANAIALSLALATVTTLIAIASTRIIVRRASWAKHLAADLRPNIVDASNGALLFMALASGVTEEIFFRGLLVPALGVVMSSFAFGAVHAFRGRWAWALWATAMGGVLAIIFALSGSLIGPIVAHVAINFTSLRLVRNRDPR